MDKVVEQAKKECSLEAVYMVEPKLTLMVISTLFSEGEGVASCLALPELPGCTTTAIMMMRLFSFSCRLVPG
jgi:hypothetical protein